MCSETKLSAEKLTEEINNLKLIFSTKIDGEEKTHSDAKKTSDLEIKNKNEKNEKNGKNDEKGVFGKDKIGGENPGVNTTESETVKIPPRIIIYAHKDSQSRTVTTKGKEKEKEKDDMNENDDENDMKCYSEHSDILFAFSPILVKVNNILNII